MPQLTTKTKATETAIHLALQLLELDTAKYGNELEARKHCYSLGQLVEYMLAHKVDPLIIEDVKNLCLDPLVQEDLQRLIDLDLGKFNFLKEFIVITVTKTDYDINLCVERRPAGILRRFFRWIRSWF